MKHAQKGFTLIEIMIVVAIIAILAAVAIPNFISYRNTSMMNACKANQKAIVAAAEAYRMNPNHTEDPASITIASLTDTSKGGYLKNEPKCGGKSYTLSYDTTKGIFSAKCGNTDTGGNEFKHQEADSTETPPTP